MLSKDPPDRSIPPKEKRLRILQLARKFFDRAAALVHNVRAELIHALRDLVRVFQWRLKLPRKEVEASPCQQERLFGIEFLEPADDVAWPNIVILAVRALLR